MLFSTLFVNKCNHFDGSLCLFNIFFYPAPVLAATQRLKELSQVHVSVSSTADQRHVTGMGSTFAAVVSNANHEVEPEILERGEEDLTAQADHTIDDILQQGLSVVQTRPNGPIVQATVDPGKEVYVY